MYGYGYPYGFYVDPTYVLLIIGMVLALAASGEMKSTFARYQQVRSHSGLTGAQTAQRILNADARLCRGTSPRQGSFGKRCCLPGR